MHKSPLDGTIDQAENALFNTSMAKGFAVLEAFTSDNRGLSLPEIAAVTKMTKSSAQRSIFTLVALGYIEKNEDTSRYRLTPKILHTGCNYLRNNMLIEVANPHLYRLNKETGETVNLAQIWGDSVIYVSRFLSKNYMLSYMTVGSILPVYCSSSGRAIISTYPQRDWSDALGETSVLHTPKTTTDKSVILGQITEAAVRGYAYTIEEFFPDDLSLAAPILGADGVAIAAVNLSLPASQWTLEDAASQIVPQLQRAAFSISASLGK